MNVHLYYGDGFYDSNHSTGKFITDKIDCIWPFPYLPRVGDIISDSLICKLINNNLYSTDKGDIYVDEVHWTYEQSIFSPYDASYSLYILLGKKDC